MNDIQNNNKQINRRNFLKVLGGGIVAASPILSACSNEAKQSTTNSANDRKEPSPETLTYRVNPPTNDRISLLGYGCMRWPVIQGEDGKKNKIDQVKLNELVDYAIEKGVNYFDTAPVYMQGQSEEAMGISLSRYPRDKYFIATKMSNFSNYERENSLAIYRNSMEKLQVDYIDYYLLHSIGGGKDAIQLLHDRFIDNGILDFLLAEREAGRIRNLGFSFHGSVKAFDYLLAYRNIKWDFVQIQLNYADWRHAGKNNVNAEYLLGELEKKNVSAIVMEPLLGGRLAKLSNNLVTRLKERNPDESVASWAFRFAGSHKSVITVLSGMTYLEHLKDNLATYSPLRPLTDDDFAFLEDTAQLMLNYPTVPCTDCKYCMPCPYGINIPAIFEHYNLCVNSGDIPKNSQEANYRKARQAYLVGYDRSVPKLRQANHCIGCNKCVEHCPQSINIPKELHRIDQYVEKLKQETL